MKFKELTKEDVEVFFNLWNNSKNKYKDINDYFGIAIRTAQEWNQKLTGKFKGKKYNFDELEESKDSSIEDRYDVVSEDKKRIYRLEEEVKILKKSLQDAKEHVTASDDIKELIFNIHKEGYNNPDTIPKWIDSKHSSNSEIVPVFCLSDIHVGSVIDPADVNYVNEYDVDIAKERIFTLTNDFIDMYINKLSNYKYKGCVLIFGGDMIENAMHGTEETNELTVINQVIETTSILIEVIERLNKAFGKVFIPSVSGNHGRLIADKYVKNSHRLDNSLEKIVYHFVELHFKDNDDISLVTSHSDILHFSINGLRFRLEHGDSIKFSGQAISGPLNSWERARLKRSGVDSAVGNGFDILIFGHFHQHLISNKIIAMDSTKGYDTYVMRMALPFSLAGATTFSVNSKGEVIYGTNLKCRVKTKQKKLDKCIEIF